MLLRMAWREIRYNKFFSFLFVVNVAIGLLGLITIENFKTSFETVLAQRAKNLLGADLTLSSRFSLKGEKEELLLKALKDDNALSDYTEFMTMFSMARSGEKSRLIFLETMNKSKSPFPFYGALRVRNLKTGAEFSYPSKENHQIKEGELWVYPEVLKQLSQESLKIGNKSFAITHEIIDDSQQTFEMGSVAPKVFLLESDAKAAGLIQKGSTIRYYVAVKTTKDVSKDFVDKLNEEIDDNAVKVTTPQKSSQQVGRVLAYLSDFLGLVSLVALFLASVGLFYLYRSHLGGKRQSFAIYSSLGLKRGRIFRLYLLHVFILSLLGSLLGMAIGSLVIPALNFFLGYVLPFELPALISLRALAMGLCVGLIGVLLLAYPLILSALQGKPAGLFQEVAEMRSGDKPLFWMHYLPYLFFFCMMTLYAARSFKVGGAFLGLFFGVTLIAFPLGLFLLRWGVKASQHLSLIPKLSFRYMGRYKVSTISIFLSLLLGSMLLNLIPMLQQSIQAELSMENESRLPSLFLFDIQDEQVEPLREFFEKKEQTKLLSLSPFIRSRIKKINDKAVLVENKETLTREQEREQRFRNRGTNLSYRDELSESETIVEGEAFPGPYDTTRDEYPLISVEQRYADRLGIELGDLLTFDVLGVPVVGKVWNLRKVRWTSFLPNFFIQFQSGVLDDAPKTWLAAVPKVEEKRKDTIQSGLYDKFPNVSAVDISRVVKKILDVMGQMSWALKAMSVLCLFVGILVLFSLANHQMEGRKNDIVLLKVIGMKLKDIRKMVLREFIGIGLCSSLLGSCFGLIVSFTVSHLFFDGLWVVSWWLPVGSIIIITLMCAFTASVATRGALKVKASQFL